MRHAKRFVLTLLLVLCLSAIQAAAANIRFYVGQTGQTLYVRIENPGGNYVATALTEGTSGGAGNYTASEATIAALTGMNSPSTGAGCAYTIRVGTPSASADDPIVGCGDLAWSGSAELRTPVDTRQVAGTAQTAADLGLAVGTVQTRIGVPVGADLSADIAAKPTAAQIWAALTSGLSTSGSVGKLIVDNLDGKVSSVGSGAADTRDLEPVQFTWTLSSRSDGTMESTNKLVIGPGEKFRCGFKCDGTKALPTAGTVLRTMATPTVTNAACTATKLGIDPSIAKIEVAADPGATAGTSGYVRTTITNNHGAGPVTLLGKFVIAKEPQ